MHIMGILCKHGNFLAKILVMATTDAPLALDELPVAGAG